ncbi:hypothetical protein PHMEG_00025720 [Phytophthora megakarya]|uniref:Uncharacterized protein n=1 Tax=Phytophthora megakarya TaxID=4795 RepID=A0A225VCT4_9STRA|nr:hypothetical protein PHMEG_00025720 [Phytophthora megakarya]
MKKSVDIRRFMTERGIESSQSVWKAITTRQCKLRLEAEETNASLRRLLQLHKNEVRNMKRMFRRRIDKEHKDLFIVKMRDPVPNQDHTGVFAELLRDIDDLYVSVDVLFQNKAMGTIHCPGQAYQVYPDVTNDIFVEFLEKSILPFSTHQTCQAVWKSLGKQRRPEAHVLSQV